MFYILHRLIYSPLEVSAYRHLRKTTESVGPILTEQLEMQLDVNNECALAVFSALSGERALLKILTCGIGSWQWVDIQPSLQNNIFGIVHFCKPRTQHQRFYNTRYITLRLHVYEPKEDRDTCRARDHCSRLDFQNCRKLHDNGWFWEDVRTFFSRFYGEKSPWNREVCASPQAQCSNNIRFKFLKSNNVKSFHLSMFFFCRNVHCQHVLWWLGSDKLSLVTYFNSKTPTKWNEFMHGGVCFTWDVMIFSTKAAAMVERRLWKRQLNEIFSGTTQPTCQLRKATLQPLLLQTLVNVTLALANR